MNTPREDLLRCLRRKGFDRVHVDYVLCESQIADFEKRFGHSDYESFFGLSHRRVELEIKRNYTNGRASLPQGESCQTAHCLMSMV